MDALPPELFVFAIIAFIAGGLFMWLINYASGGGRKGKQRHEPTTESEDPGPAGRQELLSVLRTEKGQPDVLVQGQRYRHLREITDPQVGRETVEALKAVLAFAEGLLPSIQQHQQRPAQSASTTTTTDEEAFLRQLRQTPPPPPSGPLTPPERSKVPIPGKMLDPLTMVDDIDEIVQRKLQKRPDLAGHFIRLITGPGGGPRIYVDQQVFDAVGDISNPQVRALIQDAIHEWESG